MEDALVISAGGINNINEIAREIKGGIFICSSAEGGRQMSTKVF